MILLQTALMTLALLGSAHGVASNAAGGIYTWTDRDGVIHFSDAPPPIASTPDANTPSGTVEATETLPLDEDTPVPATLNELFEPASDVTGGLPLPAREDPATDVATAPTIYRPGSGPLKPPSPEELDALDPVWFRDGALDPAAGGEVYADEFGPFTIGKPVDDAPVPPEVRCQAARRDLEVLREAWPVYRDQGGRLRYQWTRDPYRGVRRYLDDTERESALAGVQQTLRRDCPAPDDSVAQAAARAGLLQAALCEAERAELAAMESLGGDSPTQTLDEKRRLAAEVCGDPAPPTQAAETAPVQPATAN